MSSHSLFTMSSRTDELRVPAGLYALAASVGGLHPRIVVAVTKAIEPAPGPPPPETPVEASTHSAKERHAKAPTHAPLAAAPAGASTGSGAATADGVAVIKKPAAVVEEAPRSRRAPPQGEVVPIPGQRNVLITSALPYVNNVPHLGNIIGSVLSADVYARYCRQRGVNAVYICGTDEYGTATEAKAAEEHLTPRQICDKYFVQHKAIYEWFDIAFDYFGRTSCEDPWNTPEWPQTQIGQAIFKDNRAQGNLVEQATEQVFCLGCSKFLADRFIEGTCPLCAYEDARGDQCDKCGKLLNAPELLQPRCKTDRSHGVEVRSSSHLFLDLPKLEPALRAWIKKSSVEGQWTANAVSITESWLSMGLKPRCITRDLKWGTPVPDERFSDKVFYVWFDAPIGYISITANYSPDHWKQWWMNPKEVSLYQFMGKDNIPFHTVVFPASLIGTGKEWTMLHHVSTTEYLNYESGKFSKSRGVGVFGDNARDTGIASEVWRYFLLSNRPELADSVFTWTDFTEKNNNELLKNIGNLVQRALSFVFVTYSGVFPPMEAPLEERDLAFIAAINAQLGEYNEVMTAVKIKHGLKMMMDMAAEGNKYMQDSKPWELKATTPARCATVISVISHFIRLLANVAEPFMPGFTDKVMHAMGLPHGDIPDAFFADEGGALLPAPMLRIPTAGHAMAAKPIPIFSVISGERTEEFRSKFAGKQQPSAGPDAGAAPAAAAPSGKRPKSASAGGAKLAAAAAPASDMARIELRVGRITRAWAHPEADKLWCEEVDVGEDKPRMIASGLRQYYTQEAMTGRRIVVVANLKPRVMVGFESQGMVLCASNADRSCVEFIEPPAGAKVGERITVAGFSEEAVAGPGELVNPAKKANPWTIVAPELRTNGDKAATYKGVPLCTSAGPCTAPTQAEAPIS